MVIKPDLLDILKEKIFVHLRGRSNDLETGCPAKVVETATTAEKNNGIQKIVDDDKCRQQQQQQKEINDNNKQYDRQRTSNLRRSFSTFDHNQKRYRTIFDRVHCWSAAKWVVAVEFFISSLFLIDYVINNEKKQNYLPKAFLLIGVCLNSLSILAIFLYVFGMYKKWEKIMIPRFVVQALNCILFVAFAVYCLTALILLERDYKRRYSKTSGGNQTNVTISVDGYSFTTSVTYADEDYACTAVLHFVAFLVQVYCFWILLLAYRYLRDWKVFLAYV